MLRLPNADDLVDANIQTDASGSWGCGAFYNDKWSQWQWSAEWMPIPIIAKEMAPIIMSLQKALLMTTSVCTYYDAYGSL